MLPPLTDMEDLRDALKEDIQSMLLNAFGKQEQRLRMVVMEAMTASKGGIAAPGPVKTLLAPVWSKAAPHHQPVEDLYKDIEPPAYKMKDCEHPGEENEESEENGVLGGSVKFAFGGFGSAKKILEMQMNRDGLDKKAYNVMNLYKDTGVFQGIARSDHFNDFSLFVITANAMYLGVNSEHNSEATSILDSTLPFAMSENAFCIYFTLEICMRFGAFKHKADSLRDNWFRFDSCLVVLMVAETWVLPGIMLCTGQNLSAFPTAPLRLLRLLRLSRLVRLMRSLPELVTMTKGMVFASRAVASSLLMILMLIYVCAIVLHMFLRDHPDMPHKFATLPKCMWTLFMDGTLLDGTGSVVTTLLYEWTPSSLIAVFVFLVFILLSSMTVMNMLIGVLCEVVSAVAADERDEAAIILMKETILVELLKFDKDSSGTIDRREFAAAMSNNQCLAVLDQLQVDLDCLKDLQMILFPTETAEVGIDEIMDLLLQYRGNIAPTVRHMVDMMGFTRWYLAAGMRVMHERLDYRLQDLDAQHREDLNTLSQMCDALARNSSQTTSALELPGCKLSMAKVPPQTFLPSPIGRVQAPWVPMVSPCDCDVDALRPPPFAERTNGLLPAVASEQTGFKSL